MLPDLGPHYRSFYGRGLNDQLAARRLFYNVDQAETLSFEQMEETYRRKFETQELCVAWSFFERRNKFAYYFVCGVQRQTEPTRQPIHQ